MGLVGCRCCCCRGPLGCCCRRCCRCWAAPAAAAACWAAPAAAAVAAAAAGRLLPLPALPAQPLPAAAGCSCCCWCSLLRCRSTTGFFRWAVVVGVGSPVGGLARGEAGERGGLFGGGGGVALMVIFTCVVPGQFCVGFLYIEFKYRIPRSKYSFLIRME